jgi:hypothetical protein
MTPPTESDRRVVRRRRSVRGGVFVLMLAVVAALNYAYRFEMGAPHLVDFLRLGALIILALVVALRATTGFSFMKTDPAMNDELARANRAAAARRGFWTMMIAAIGICIGSLFFPFTAYEVMLVMLLTGAGAAGLSFARLEAKDGG